MIFDLVRMLCECDEQAFLWLPEAPVESDWCYGSVPTVLGRHLDMDVNDIVVLPEIAVHPHADPAPGGRKVVFNQNHFLTLASWDSTEPVYSDWAPRPQVWTVSREAQTVLSDITHLNCHLVPPRIDYTRFAPKLKRANSIALMPRKRPRQAEILIRLLTERFASVGRPIELSVVDGQTPNRVADVLSHANVFVALSRSEGLGLPVQEALASGCHVVGYSGGGGRDLFRAPSAHLIADDCMTDLADCVTRLAIEQPDGCAANRDWVMHAYTDSAARAALDAALVTSRATPGAAARARHPAADFSYLPDDFFTAI